MPEDKPEITDSPGSDWRKAVMAWRTLPPKEKRRNAREVRERKMRLRHEGQLADGDFYDRYCQENTMVITGPAEYGQ